MATFSQIDTANGLTQKAATITTTYTVTRVAIGSGTVGTPFTATALGAQQIASVTLGAWTIINPGEFVVQVTINSANFTGTPFVLTEMGLFGTSGAGPEQLTTYYNVFNGPLIENSTTNPAQILYLVLNTAIANASAVNVTIGTGVYALESDFVTHLADPAAHPQAFINPFNLSSLTKQGLIIALNGVTTDYFGGDGQWHHGLQVITSNITLFVALGNPNIYPNFSSIQNALAWLSPYFIISGVTVTVAVAAGTYTQSTPILVTHPQGAQISIQGTIGATTTITAFGSTSGSTGNYSITFSVASATGFSVNDWLLIDTVPGIPSAMLNGFYQLTAISGSSLTVKLPYPRTGLGTLGPISSGNVRSLKSIISPNAGVRGFQCGNLGDTTTGVSATGNGLGMLQNIGFVGPGSTSDLGIVVGGGATLNMNSVGVANFAGTAVSALAAAVYLGGNLNATKFMASGCFDGVGCNGGGSIINLTASCSNYHSNYGFRTDSAFMSLAGNSFAFGCLVDGFLVADHAYGAIGGFYSYYNGRFGFNCGYHSQITVGPSSVGSALGNVSDDIFVGPCCLVVNESGTLQYSTSSVDSAHFGVLIP